MDGSELEIARAVAKDVAADSNDELLPLKTGQLQESNPLPQTKVLCEKTQSEAWGRVEALLHQDYVNPNMGGVKIVCACVAAHRLTMHAPVWLMCVAPSGSLKTAILQSLYGLPHVHFVDEVTPNTFVSGRIPEHGNGDKKDKREKKTPASLLHRIGKDGFLVAADFSTILAMDERSRARILAQLRRIYDGQFSREFGTEEDLEEREWKGRLTLITGVTPDIDSHYSVFRSLGERFVQVRWPRAGGVETGLRALRQRRNAARDLMRATHELLLPILQEQCPRSPRIPASYERRIANLGEFVALARASVLRTRSDHEPIAPPSPEGNTRLPQEFAQIGRGAALLACRDHVVEEDYLLIERAAFDCIPATRRSVIEAIRDGRHPSSALSGGLLQRALDDLQRLGLVLPRTSGYDFTELANELMAGTKE